MEIDTDTIQYRIVEKWNTPPGGVQEFESTTDELKLLFSKLPEALSHCLYNSFDEERLKLLSEIYLQLGHRPECIFADKATGSTTREFIADFPCEQQHIDLFAGFFTAEGTISLTKRRGIAKTLHRVSLITHPGRSPEKVIGVAVRVGRALKGLLGTMTPPNFLIDLAKKRNSLLLIGKPGVGKTTVLREMACVLSSDLSLNVVVVDKTCEIAGDGDVPHAAIGSSRWMPVSKPNTQHLIMREAVENQSPDVIIVDEISTPLEVDAARTIAQRGVQLIATVHGQTLPEIINCKERGYLVGGCVSVTLSGREADKRSDKRKQVNARAREPVFHAAIELQGRSNWIFHRDIKESADNYFDDVPFEVEGLQPGKKFGIVALSEEGSFDYCGQCHAGKGQLCDYHRSWNDGSFDYCGQCHAGNGHLCDCRKSWNDENKGVVFSPAGQGVILNKEMSSPPPRNKRNRRRKKKSSVQHGRQWQFQL